MADAIGKPAYEGAVVIENGRAVPEYPRAGLAIDVEAAVPLIADALSSPQRGALDVPLVPLEPKVTFGDVDVAVVKANEQGAARKAAAIEPYQAIRHLH